MKMTDVKPRSVTHFQPEGKCRCGGKVIGTSVWHVYWCDKCHKFFELGFMPRKHKYLVKKYGQILL